MPSTAPEAWHSTTDHLLAQGMNAVDDIGVGDLGDDPRHKRVAGLGGAVDVSPSFGEEARCLKTHALKTVTSAPILIGDYSVLHALGRSVALLPAWEHHERPHHVVVLVLQDVAVPYVVARVVLCMATQAHNSAGRCHTHKHTHNCQLGAYLEGDEDGGDLVRVGPDGILVPILVGVGREGRARVDNLAIGVVGGHVEWPTLKQAELREVQVNGVRVRGEVDEAPQLDRVDTRRLGGRVMEAKSAERGNHDRGAIRTRGVDLHQRQVPLLERVGMR